MSGGQSITPPPPNTAQICNKTHYKPMWKEPTDNKQPKPTKHQTHKKQKHTAKSLKNLCGFEVKLKNGKK
jgi:hypothetical protein